MIPPTDPSINDGENIEIVETSISVPDGPDLDSHLMGDQNEKTNQSQEFVDQKNKESKDFSFPQIWSEFSMNTMYNDRDWQEMATTAARNLTIGAVPSGVDVFTDIHLFFDYL